MDNIDHITALCIAMFKTNISNEYDILTAIKKHLIGLIYNLRIINAVIIQ